MGKLILVLTTFFCIFGWSSAFADTNSSSEKSPPKSDTEISDAYYYAHAAGIMSHYIKYDSGVSYVDVLRLIKED
jgi:hypothetical protein